MRPVSLPSFDYYQQVIRILRTLRATPVPKLGFVWRSADQGNIAAVITHYNCLKFTFYVNSPDFKLLLNKCDFKNALHNIDITCVTYVFQNAEALAKHVTVGVIGHYCKQHTTEAIRKLDLYRIKIPTHVH